jgi:hypothetical protein
MLITQPCCRIVLNMIDLGPGLDNVLRSICCACALWSIQSVDQVVIDTCSSVSGAYCTVSDLSLDIMKWWNLGFVCLLYCRIYMACVYSYIHIHDSCSMNWDLFSAYMLVCRSEGIIMVFSELRLMLNCWNCSIIRLHLLGCYHQDCHYLLLMPLSLCCTAFALSGYIWGFMWPMLSCMGALSRWYAWLVDGSSSINPMFLGQHVDAVKPLVVQWIRWHLLSGCHHLLLHKQVCSHGHYAYDWPVHLFWAQE